MVDGILNLEFWGYVAMALLLTHITIVSVTVFLHRHQAHRAIELHPVISHFFRFWLWLTSGMGTKAWVAIHRKHHAKCETVDDPHSPQILGIKKVLWQGAELYRQEATNPDTLRDYGQGTPDDWIEKNVYTKMHNLGIIFMFIINLILFGLPGITIWAIQMLWIPLWAAGVINGIGHYWGYRNYECTDAATNIVPWGILIGGEELHNNHHTYASSAKFSSKPWEFDIGWFYIQVLAKLKLATVKRVAPTPVIDRENPSLDTDTLKAIVTHRFQIMACYAKQVIAEVNKQELTKANTYQKDLLRRAKKLLIREEALMDAEAKQRLHIVLQENHTLKTVYEFKQSLQELWTRSAVNLEVPLAQLQDWCKQAEATGIKALEEFAQHLRTYSLDPAQSPA